MNRLLLSSSTVKKVLMSQQRIRWCSYGHTQGWITDQASEARVQGPLTAGGLGEPQTAGVKIKLIIIDFKLCKKKKVRND